MDWTDLIEVLTRRSLLAVLTVGGIDIGIAFVMRVLSATSPDLSED